MSSIELPEHATDAADNHCTDDLRRIQWHVSTPLQLYRFAIAIATVSANRCASPPDNLCQLHAVAFFSADPHSTNEGRARGFPSDDTLHSPRNR